MKGLVSYKKKLKNLQEKIVFWVPSLPTLTWDLLYVVFSFNILSLIQALTNNLKLNNMNNNRRLCPKLKIKSNLQDKISLLNTR